MVLVGRFALIVSTFANGLEEDNAMLQHQHHDALASGQAPNPGSPTNPFRWKQCQEVRKGNYGSHVKECVGTGQEVYVQVNKRKGGTTCQNEGLFPITTVTQCKAALDALGLTADNVEAGLDPNYQPRPIDVYTGMKMHKYPNGRPTGCSYHESWPLVWRTSGGMGGGPQKRHMSAAYVHIVSADNCGSGGWDCICTDKPVTPVVEPPPETLCYGAGGCDPLEVATDEFCAFFCGNADPGHVTGQCDDLNPNFWSYLKKGNNKARNVLCADQCAPQPVNGVCVRQTTEKAVLYQDLCYSDAKAWNSGNANGGSNDQMSRMMSDFCTFVCAEDAAGPTGRECKHKDNNNDVNLICSHYCSFKQSYNIAGVMQPACSKNQNTKDLCTPVE